MKTYKKPTVEVLSLTAREDLAGPFEMMGKEEDSGNGPVTIYKISSFGAVS